MIPCAEFIWLSYLFKLTLSKAIGTAAKPGDPSHTMGIYKLRVPNSRALTAESLPLLLEHPWPNSSQTLRELRSPEWMGKLSPQGEGVVETPR